MQKGGGPSRSARERRHDRRVIAGGCERERLTAIQTLGELKGRKQVVVLVSRCWVVFVPERPCVLAVGAVAAPAFLEGASFLLADVLSQKVNETEPFRDAIEDALVPSQRMTANLRPR